MTEMSIKGFAKYMQKELAKLVGRLSLLEETVDGDGADLIALEATVEELAGKVDALESALRATRRMGTS